MNTESTNPNPTSRSSRTLVWVLVAVLGLTAGAGFVLLGGGDDDAELTAVEPVTEVVEDDSQADVADETPAESDAPAESVEESTDDAPAENEADAAESSDRPEVPTIVIGQDEEGNDIIVELEIAAVCAQTFHEPLDANSFSFIRWTYEAPGLEPGQPIKVFNDAGFEHFTVVTPDYKIVVEQGITSYGDYPFPSIEWNVDADSSSSIFIDDTHTVDDKEGEASETCVEEEG